MSIETEFESTITNVQNAYQGLDNLGATIPQNKTIENIKNCLDEIYNNLPKTDYAEGSNITLSNTLKGKLDFEDDIVGYGDTKQEGTPTPDNPQEIEVVRGKNRFDGELLPNSYNPTTGEIEASGTSYRSNKIPLQKNETYYLSGITGNVRVLYWNNTSYVSSEVITMPNSFITKGNIIAFQFDKSLSHENIMIEKGSQATSYLPYNTIEVVERGINLLDKTQVVGNNTATTVTQINTGFRVSAETLGYAGVTTIDVKANTNYFLKFNTNVIVDSGTQKYVRIFAGTTQTTTIATYTFTEGEGTFNTGNNTKINIWFYCSLGGSGTVDYTNVQLQEGSTATTYEPYQTPQTYQLSLGEYEFAKIGNYVDTLEYDVDEDKVYKNKAVEKIASYNGQTITTDYISTTGQLTTGAKVYYGISTTKEEITGTLKDQIKALYNSHSFNGTTIIEIDGNLPLIIKVRALKGE